MGYRPLTTEVLSSFLGARDLLWVQDENERAGVELVRETCKGLGAEFREVVLSQAWPLDLREMFDGLSDEGGVMVFRGVEDAHEYLGLLLKTVLMYREFRTSSISNATPIPDNWKIVIVTSPRFVVEDRALYRKLLKLVNPRTPMEV